MQSPTKWDIPLCKDSLQEIWSMTFSSKLILKHVLSICLEAGGIQNMTVSWTPDVNLTRIIWPIEEVKSGDYSAEMQDKMGGFLTYKHEDGMNYAHVLDNLVVGSCLQTAEDLDRLAADSAPCTRELLRELSCNLSASYICSSCRKQLC